MTSLTEWRTSRPTLKVEHWTLNVERLRVCVHSRKRGKGGEGKMQSIVHYRGFEGMWVTILMTQCKHMWDMAFECLEGGLLLSAEHGTACVEIFTALSDQHLLNQRTAEISRSEIFWKWYSTQSVLSTRECRIWRSWTEAIMPDSCESCFSAVFQQFFQNPGGWWLTVAVFRLFLPQKYLSWQYSHPPPNDTPPPFDTLLTS